MSRGNLSKAWLIAVAGCLLLCLGRATAVMADAKADLSIAPKGACAGGGTTFVITNNNPNSSIHATLSQSTANASPTTIDISLQPGEQKVLGCAAQGPAGNFLVKWQVQSAQYL